MSWEQHRLLNCHRAPGPAPCSEQVQSQDFKHVDFVQNLSTGTRDAYSCLKTISLLNMEKLVLFVKAWTPTETIQKWGKQNFFYRNKCGNIGWGRAALHKTINEHSPAVTMELEVPGERWENVAGEQPSQSCFRYLAGQVTIPKHSVSTEFLQQLYLGVKEIILCSQSSSLLPLSPCPLSSSPAPSLSPLPFQ